VTGDNPVMISDSGSPTSWTPSRISLSPILGDFNLEATVRLLQRRPANRVDRWQDDSYLRAFLTAEGPRRVRVTNAGTVDTPDVRLEILDNDVSPETATRLMATVRRMLGLDVPPAPTAWLIEMEPRLAPVATALHGFRPPCFPCLFETFAAVIPFQQLSLDAGTAIIGRLVEAFGLPLPHEQGWFVFPTPEAIADASPDALRATGLSRTKVASLQALAQLSVDGTLEAMHLDTRSTDDAFTTLRRLPGIGPWSAGLVLLRGLRRMDVFPVGDVGAARSLTGLLGLPAPLTPAEASAFADRFGDRRGYLYFLCLGSQLLARERNGAHGGRR
jgi:DNA-3-methyladenine glycosylase II